jgi:hypothetical protein
MCIHMLYVILFKIDIYILEISLSYCCLTMGVSIIICIWCVAALFWIAFLWIVMYFDRRSRHALSFCGSTRSIDPSCKSCYGHLFEMVCVTAWRLCGSVSELPLVWFMCTMIISSTICFGAAVALTASAVNSGSIGGDVCMENHG